MASRGGELVEERASARIPVSTGDWTTTCGEDDAARVCRFLNDLWATAHRHSSARDSDLLDHMHELCLVAACSDATTASSQHRHSVVALPDLRASQTRGSELALAGRITWRRERE